MISNTIIGHWKLNEKSGTVAHDSTTNINHGTIVGTSIETGIFDRARVFYPSSEDRIQIPDNSLFKFIGEPFTITAWFKRSSVPSQTEAIISKWNGGSSNKEWEIVTNTDGTIAFNVSSNGTSATQLVESSIAITDDDWHLVTVTRSENLTRLFIDGAVIDRNVFTPTLFASTAELVIGNHSDSTLWDGSFDGYIDHVRIYNYQLSEEEVNDLYFNTGFDAFAPVIVDIDPMNGQELVNPEDPIIFWYLDQNPNLDTLNVSFNSNPIMSSGVPQDGYYSISSQIFDGYSDGYDGYEIYIYPESPLPERSRIDVEIDTADAYGTFSTYSYHFWTSSNYDPPPSFDNLNPLPGTTGMNTTDPVTFQFNDGYHIGVDLVNGANLSSLQVKINDEDPIINGAIQIGFSGSITPNGFFGYDVVLYRDIGWPIARSLNISLDGEDNTGTGKSFSYIVKIGGGPIVTNIVPPDGSIERLEQELVIFNVYDATFGVDKSDIEVTIDDILAVQNGVTYNGHSVSFAEEQDGYLINIWHPTWQEYADIIVEVDVVNRVNEAIHEEFSFRVRDYLAPTIVPTAPINNGQRVRLDSNVEFQLWDYGSGIDRFSLDVSIAGEAAVIDGVAGEGFTVEYNDLPDGDGYWVVVEKLHPFHDLQTVPVSVYVEDNTENPVALQYNFFTEDTLSPTIRDLSPGDGDSISGNDHLLFSAHDGYGVGVALHTINVLVDGSFAVYNGSYQSGFGGQVEFMDIDGYDGYRFTIDPEFYFQYGESVDVYISLKDAYGNESNTSYTFTVHDIRPPIISHLDPYDGAISSLRPHIRFKISEPGGIGVDTSRLDVTVDDLPAIVGGYVAPRFSGDVEETSVDGADGYNVWIRLDSRFDPSTVHTVVIDGYDLLDQGTRLVYSFTTTDDITLPTFEGFSPEPGQLNVNRNTAIFFEFNDDDSGVDFGADINLLNVSIDGVQAVVNGQAVNGFVLNFDANEKDGYDVELLLASQLDQSKWILVELDGYDEADNFNSFSYEFRTEKAPAFSNFSPSLVDDRVSTNTNISFDFIEIFSGPNMDSLNVLVNGREDVIGGFPLHGNTIVVNTITDGYNIDLDLNYALPEFSTILVELDGYDHEGTQYNGTFWFGTDDESEPVLSSPVPADGSVSVTPYTSIGFNLHDVYVTVDTSTLNVQVSDINAVINNVPQTGWEIITTPAQVDGYSGYSFYLTFDERFSLNTDIRVLVDCDDAYGNHMSEDFSFRTYQDLVIPEIVNASPSSGQTEVGLYEDVQFKIIDGYDIDLDRLDVSINNWPAIKDGAFQEGFYGPSSALYQTQDGYGIVIDPINKFPFNAQISVVIDGYDFSNNHINSVYYFYTETDTEEPVVSNRDPDIGDVEVALASNISFDITDTISGVDFTRLNIHLSSVPLMLNGEIQSGWDGPLTSTTVIPDGYSIVIDPDGANELTYNQVRVVTIDGYDLASNHVHDEYVFTTILDPNAPVVSNMNPLPSQDEVPVAKDISMDITDAVAGVVLSTLNITINGIPAITDGVIKQTYGDVEASITSIANGYRINLDRFVDFDYNETVSVNVDVYDDADNHLQYNYFFITKVDVNGPTVTPISPEISVGEYPRSVAIVMEVTDLETGVDLSRFDVTIDNQPAIIDGEFQHDFAGAYSKVIPLLDGYYITIDPINLFDADKEIRVVVDGYDFGNSQTHFEYLFATIDNVGPEIFDIYPEPNSINIPNDPVHISFGIRDVGRHSVDFTGFKVEASVGADEDYVTVYDHENKFGDGWSGYFELAQSTDGYYFHAFNDDDVTLILYSIRVTAIDGVGNVGITQVGKEGGLIDYGVGTVSGFDTLEVGEFTINSTNVDYRDILVIENVDVFSVDGYTNSEIITHKQIPAGGLVNYKLYRGSFITERTELTIESVLAADEYTVEARFNGVVADPGTISTYSITGGDEPLNIVTVTQANDRVVYLTTDDPMEPLAEYELAVVPDDILDPLNFTLYDGYTTFPFLGFTDRIGPRIARAWVAPFNINVTVLFDDYMLQNENLALPTNYTFSHGAYVTDVEIADADKVILTVENLYGRPSFDLFLSSNLKDAFGNKVDYRFNHAIVTHESSAAFSGATGRLKTRDEINRLYEDHRYWYAATSGGLDVISKDDMENQGYVLDAYGVNVVTADDGYIYFASDDGYAVDAYHTAVYKIEFGQVDGNSTARKIEAFGYPVIQSTHVNDLVRGNHAGDSILVIATDAGITLTIQDKILQYSSGNDIQSVQLDDGGTKLYAANNTLGRVEVYYNIHLDVNNRSEPDAYYDMYYNIPNINQIKVVSGSSIMDPNSNVIYIATDNGLFRIETDESSPGVSEEGGIIFSYGTENSGALFNILGGQTNKVVAVDINMNLLQIFALTSEPFNSGGMTTINIPSNTVFSFRSYEHGTLISRDLRDLTFKNL